MLDYERKEDDRMKPDGYVLSIANREYKIINYIGRGATTIAYNAECTENGITTKCILKEYDPIDRENYDKGKLRFVDSGRRQNDIRNLTTLQNQVPPVRYVFETEDAAYADIACYGGATLDKITGLTLLQYIEICLTIAKTVNYYHKAGFLCLDLKPENVFILQNTENDTITQLVEFIDFDSVCSLKDRENGFLPSYTGIWAAPEQLKPFSIGEVSEATDIYILGKLVFFYTFGRQSTEAEHRGFSVYPFNECKREYKKYLERQEIKNLFTKLFRCTLRSSPSNRTDDMQVVIDILERIADEIDKPEYVITKVPYVSPVFYGRENELTSLEDALLENRIVFLTGVGGIGKSAIARNFIDRNRENYDSLLYLEYDRNIVDTFNDDKSFAISTLDRNAYEDKQEYFDAKLTSLSRVCADKRVLIVVDNYSGKIDKNLSNIFDLGFDTIVVTRQLPPTNAFTSICIGRITDDEEILKIVSKNIGHRLTEEERTTFKAIADKVDGHTLIMELIARQIAAGNLDIKAAYDLIARNGVLNFSDAYIDNYKDGVEVYGTLSSIIGELFTLANMSMTMQMTLKTLALTDYKGIESDIAKGTLNLEEKDIRMLRKEGWITEDNVIRLHPVIKESVNKALWPKDADDLDVMKAHDSILDVYEGYSDYEYMRKIIEYAEEYAKDNDRHIIKGMLHDMWGSYYDIYAHMVNLEQEDYDKIINQLADEVDRSVQEFEQSKDRRAYDYLVKAYISDASVWVAESCDYDYVEQLLNNVSEIVNENEGELSINQCYINTTWASYYSRRGIKKDKAIEHINKAVNIAKKIDMDDAEYIDIISIPSANYMYFYEEYDAAIKILNEAAKVCEKHGDTPYYISKLADLLSYECDVYIRAGKEEKCEELESIINELRAKLD